MTDNALLATPAAAIALIAISLQVGCSQVGALSEQRVDVGSTTVTLLTSGSQKAGFWMINVHDDENTSVHAGRRHARRFGGSVLELVHAGGRYIEFGIDGASYRADPNRIFTQEGLQRTVGASDPAHPAVLEAASLATAIIDEIRSLRPDWVVALHNNTEGSYSVQSYLAGGTFHGDAEAVHRNTRLDTDDFFFVTDGTLYRELSRRNLNVVLQNNERVTDDGSLSVFCAREGIRYVNVEAQHGHTNTQASMLKALRRVLK